VSDDSAALARNDEEIAMRPVAMWAAVAAAAAVVVAVATVIAIFWHQLGASEISLAGWLAMVFGVIVTLALGIGLMALMFISNRRGFDDPGHREG
jgi:protein-S-isoprenylcysteine O-methyltransferase Ste14